MGRAQDVCDVAEFRPLQIGRLGHVDVEGEPVGAEEAAEQEPRQAGVPPPEGKRHDQDQRHQRRQEVALEHVVLADEGREHGEPGEAEAEQGADRGGAMLA